MSKNICRQYKVRNYNMVGRIQRIKIEKLINYSENPRHPIGNDEMDTMEKLFIAVGKQYMLNLAEDIQKNGLLGNQQIVVVYSEDIKKYVVYEGNRRVAAIKLLLNPERFVFLDKATIEKVKRIVKDSNVIDTLDCYVTTEENAFFIMERVHSGENKGRGTKEWGAREKDTFQVRRNNTKKLSYLIDFYVRKYCDGLDITTILPFTTIQRIFNNREVRKSIGLDIANEKTFTIQRMRMVVEASNWIVRESEANGMAVTRLFNKASVIEYKLLPWIDNYLNDKFIESTDKTEKAPSRKNEYYDSSNTNNDDTNENSSNNNRHKNNIIANNINEEGLNREKNTNLNRTENTQPKGDKNLPYFFQGINCSQLSPNDSDTHGVIAICNELQLLSERKHVAKYPVASAFLVRAIIEQSIKYYSKKHKIQGQDKYIWDNIKDFSKLSAIIKNYNNNLANYIVESSMRQYFTNLFGDYEKSIDPLNWVVHRPEEYQLDTTTLIELPKKGLLALINFFLS